MTTLQENTTIHLEAFPHILVMEDDLSVAKGLEMVLSEEGYNVNLAGTGELAMEAFRQKRFDLLVADLRLPDIDGMEVIERVKTKKPDTPVVIITGYPSVSSAVKAVKMGVSDYLRKPFTDDEFMSAVDGALKEKQEASMEKLITETEKDRLIQKQEVIQVLGRASQDDNFWRELMENGSVALEGYRLSRKAKAAIVSGDLNWIQENVGELTEEELRFIHKRLEREAW